MLIWTILISSILADKDHAFHKHDSKLDKYKERYLKNKEKYLKEEKNEDPTTILIWWAPNYPLLEKIPEKCGGCWLTHQKRLEKEASGFGSITFLNVSFKLFH